MTTLATNVVPMDRTCCKCSVSKPITEYYRSKSEKTGHNFMCKSCHTGWHRDRLRKDHNWRSGRYAERRESYAKNPEQRTRAYARSIAKLYGVTIEQVIQTLSEQQGLCANRGCGVQINLDAKAGAKNRAVIDHNHTTGKFRAVLCNRCNILAGQIESDVNRTMGIMDYLAKHNSN